MQMIDQTAEESCSGISVSWPMVDTRENTQTRRERERFSKKSLLLFNALNMEYTYFSDNG